MGIELTYYIVQNRRFQGLIGNDDEKVTIRQFQLLPKSVERLNVGLLWDSLHFVMTGISASPRVENNVMSDIIRGFHSFYQDGDNHHGYILWEELPVVIRELESADWVRIRKRYKPYDFVKNSIYPNNLARMKMEQIMDLLYDMYVRILAFMKKAYQQKSHVILSLTNKSIHKGARR